MKKFYSIALAILTQSIFVLGQTKTDATGAGSKATNSNGQWAWTVQPFDHKLFIENRGQFDKLVDKNNKVLFGAQLGDDLFAYFTTKGVIYRLCVYPKLTDAKKELAEKKGYDPDREEIKPVITYLSSEWENSNPEVTVDASGEQKDYYTYPVDKTTIQVNIFKKITYKNLYPGIDAEYSFYPDKQGFKYALIVHPGADLSKVKFKYIGDKGMTIDGSGDITIKSAVGDIIDHAPVTTYQTGGNVTSSYNLTGSEESFNCGSYDNTQTLVIDPWTWTSSPALATNKAYDVNYDNIGEIFVYGSSGTWQLAKFNSAGVKQWTYNATPISTGYYGDFSCDRFSGKCFCTEGFNSTGMQSIEVSSAGIQLSLTKTIPQLQEGWRDAWDPCKGITIIGGGSWQTTCDAGGSVDTNNNVTPVNVLNENATEEGHDMVFTCVDPNGVQCYMASAQSAGDPTNFNNIMCQLPVPALAPTTYQTSTGYTFQESNVAKYVGSYVANGMNGMVASATWLYIYDGETLKRVNKGTGAIVTTKTIGTTSQDWSGLDVDPCENLYVGENTAVQVYSPTLTLTTTYATSNTVYDLQLGKNYQALYACGNGFLSYMPLPAPPTTITKTRTPSSPCGCTGTASAQLTECTTPITTGVTYAWSNGATTSSVSNLCAGTYTITITQNTCPVSTYTDTVLIKGGGAGGLTLTPDSTATVCGGSIGVAGVTVTGGVSPYTYSWSTGATTSNITGLSAGSYCVTVTDHLGCKDSICIAVTNITTLAVTTGPIVEVSCYNGSNGSIQSNPTGGNPAYTYLWTPTSQTNSTATGLTAGTYTITVTDTHGCVATASAIVTEPTQLRDSITTFKNPLCNNASNGTASVGVKGGTTPYTYLWSPSGGAASTASGLSAGSYTVTVTDKNGCTNTATVTLANPTPVTVTTTTTASSCLGNTGSATATPSGGTGGTYTYGWAPSGGTNATAPNLSSGTYTVTVKDSNGCSATATAIVGSIGGETCVITDVKNVQCYNVPNGSATDSASGGTTPYTYVWSNGKTTSTITGLSAGSYTVTTTDHLGCICSAIITITQPTQLRDSITSVTNILCNGQSTGSASVGVKGGTTAYTYAWTPSGGTGTTASGLSAGTYTVTVTDAHGCNVTASATITEPPLLKLTAAAFPTTCNGGGDGQATVIPSGGVTPYTYAWTPSGGTSANANNLSAGTYTVTVTDKNGCTHDTSLVVTQPLPLVTAFTADTLTGCYPLCFNFKDGSTDPNGGTITKWSWNFGDGGTDTVQNPRHCYTSAGQYTVSLTITNNKGCTGSLTQTNMITVWAHPTPDFTFGPQPTTIFEPTISFTDKSSDPYGIASWSWNFNDPGNDVGSNLPNPTHAYSDTGIFCPVLTVTNIHGCVDSITHCLVISPQYTLFIPDAFSPNGDGKNDVFIPKGDYVYDYNMYIFDRWGLMIFHSTSLYNGWNGSYGGSICQEDTYVYLITCTDNLGQKHSYIGKVTLLK